MLFVYSEAGEFTFVADTAQRVERHPDAPLAIADDNETLGG